MTASIDRRTPQILLVWLVIEALVPRESFLRPLYLFNTYAILPLVLLIVVRGRLAGGGWRVRRPAWPDLALVAFSALAFVSMLATLGVGPSFVSRAGEFTRAFLVPFAAFWLVRLARVGRREVEEWVPALAALCVIEVAVAILALAAPGALPASVPGYAGENGGIRVTGTLTQPDAFAGFLVFAASVAFSLCADADDRARRATGALLFVLGFATAFASFSRASWVGGTAAMGVLAVAHRGRLVGPALRLAVVIAGLTFVPARAAQAPLPDTSSPPGAGPSQEAPRETSYALERLSNTRTIFDRVTLGAAGLGVFLDAPIVGCGYGTYDVHARPRVATTGSVEPSEWARLQAASHNTHISILAELGILGYICFVGPISWVAWRSVGALRASRWNRPLLLTWWAVLVFVGLIGLSIDLRFIAPAMGLFWLVLGLASVEADRDASRA